MKKHIVMYIGSLGKGGAEHVMCNLAEYFFKEGYKVTIATTYYEDDEYEIPHGLWKRQAADDEKSAYMACSVLNPREDSRVVYVPSDGEAEGIRRVFTALMPDEKRGRIRDFFARSKKLKDTWKDLKPDLILSFIGKNNIMALGTASRMGIPVVVSVRSNPSREYGTKTLRKAVNRLFPKAAGVVLQTNGAKKWFAPKIQEKCCILPNSVSEDFIVEEPVQFEQRTKTIVSVGRLDENKNQKILIEAFARLMDRFPEYKLVFYGDGQLRNNLELQASKYADKSRISFEGSVSDVAKRIKDARILVLTSKEEGLPNTLIEAMCLGVVPISTDCPCGGPADIITDKGGGILIPMGTDEEMVNSLAEALERVMSDDKFAQRLSRNALKARERYAPERINSLWKEYLDRIMNEDNKEVGARKSLIEYAKQFISFGLIGGLNTLLSLGIYWLVVFLGGHYLLANAIAFAITVFISYVLNNIFTFKGEGKAEWSFKTLFKVYVSYSITGLFLASILLWIWTDCLGINENIAPIINLFFTIPINFLLNKFWAYKKN